MSNRDKLKDLLMEIFLLDEKEFSFDLTRDSIKTWDSLGLVVMAVGIHDTFGYHLTPEEAVSIKGIPDIISMLESKGISFNE